MADQKKYEWLDDRYSGFAEFSAKCRRAWTTYLGDITKLRSEKYLIQRVTGEHDDNFDERMRTADFDPLFGTFVDKYMGRMMAAESRVKRVFNKDGKGLGDLDDPTSLAYQWWRDVDGSGMDYSRLLEDVLIRTLVFTRGVWTLVTGPRRENGVSIGNATARLYMPWDIVNYFPDGDPADATEVLVRGFRDPRTSIKDKRNPDDSLEVYTLFTLDGVEQIEVVTKKGKTEYRELGKKPYGHTLIRDNDKNQPRLPIFHHGLSLRRDVGPIMSEKNLVVFNQESERDNVLRIGCIPYLMLVGHREDISDNADSKEKGQTILHHDGESSLPHQFVSPDPGVAAERTNTLEKKVEAYDRAGLQQYANSQRGGRERTATEATQDVITSESAFLSMLGNAMSLYEEKLNWRKEQYELPNTPGQWGGFEVQRPKEYPADTERAEVDKVVGQVFVGEAIPIGALGRFNTAKKYAKAYGIEVDEDEIRAEIGAADEQSEVDNDAQSAADNPTEDTDEDPNNPDNLADQL